MTTFLRAVTVGAVGTEEVVDLADMLHTEPLGIDADTGPRCLRPELRRNGAYQRLGLAG